MRCDIVSIFPEYLEPLNLSLPGQAQRKGLLEIAVHDLRDFAHDRHRTVDDTPYGGGAGMVMKPQPWWEALAHVRSLREGTPTLIVPGPGGEVLNQELAHELSRHDWLVFACGRYEGIDERVYEAAAEVMPVRVISLGDYVLNGGEVAVLAMIEAAARLLPGFMGNADSLVEESHEDGLLEYPVYTKPAAWQGREVPSVLLSGDHGKVAAWRHQQRLDRTAARRPDLLHAAAALTGDGIAPVVAVPSDLGELLTVQRACWADVAVEVGLDESMTDVLAEDVDELRAAQRSWTTWVVRDSGRVVATVRARQQGERQEVWEIDRLMVVPDLQGRGLARALLAFVEAQAPVGVQTIRSAGPVRSERALALAKRAKYRALPVAAGGLSAGVFAKRVRRG